MGLKDAAKAASEALFQAGQRVGMFVAPRHYYVPLAPWAELQKTKHTWNRPLDLSSIAIDLDEEIATLNLWVDDTGRAETAGNGIYRAAVAARAGPGFGYIEAQVLHCFVRTLAPAKIIEVGSGVSTHCMLAASQQNVEDGRPASQITRIEPFPSAHLKSSPGDADHRAGGTGRPGGIRHLAGRGPAVHRLSHAVRPCGDVARLYLEVLPRLKPGVHVHIHDIYLPYAFQREPKGYMQWMETAMLVALISHSPRYKVTLSLSHLHYAAPQALKQALPEYDPQPNDGGLRGPGSDLSQHFPASTFLLVS